MFCLCVGGFIGLALSIFGVTMIPDSPTYAKKSSSSSSNAEEESGGNDGMWIALYLGGAVVAVLSTCILISIPR
jgi:hypothetical protein